MIKYVIYKASRAPDHTYDGATWDKAGIRELRQDFYYDLVQAQRIAKALSEANPVGFKVSVHEP